ncbi:hypothetical protein FOVG_16574 [Fusarium oxysporum f. sp. pisi HDV247]|uniref:Fungal N-terminal domain-containing protein n=1 Tax=Fusarium oxysporum f. sp. pisi HDV247 TaxID=1080344 RepID=W9NHE6_FUSOX|nr:hypothetical protein FOVG_16574 [Fusarium oxysporum f. sp. pisi HDV247]
MGDPLSIASGIAGLVSLGLTLCNSLHTYFSAIKDRHSEVDIITQSLALLKFHIFIVQSSASKLGHRYSLAADGVNLSLINCETQLKSLEGFLNELIPINDPSAIKEIWQKQKLIARYPFDRKKLVQLQEYLSRANTTLSSFIQTLTFDVNIGMSDDLEALKAYVKAQDTNTQTILRTITTRLDIISPIAQPSDMNISTLPANADRRSANTSSNSIVSHQASLNAPKMQLVPSGRDRIFEAITKAHSKPRYLQNAQLERRIFKKMVDSDCTCGASITRSGYRCPSKVYRFWSGLTISRRGDIQGNHRPGCVLFNKSPRRSSKTTLTYFGLLSATSQYFTMSITQEYVAGPYSLSFGLQPCNIVENSPAFRLFKSGEHPFYNVFGVNRISSDQAAGNIIHELRRIYKSRRASPFDVDQDGNNIAHKCLEACLRHFDSGDIAIDAIYRLLSYMVDIGVPVTASNFHQFNVLHLSAKSAGDNLWILPRLYSLIKNRYPKFSYEELAHNGHWSLSCGVGGGRERLRRLNILCEYPEISEEIGFSDLFLAAMQKDQGRLQAILEEDNIAFNISQTDFYERNILHMSSCWPAGLKLLLERQDVRALMNMNSPFRFGSSPLDHALLYSGMYCNAPDQWTLCHDCACYTAVQLLLEADCSVTVGSHRAETLTCCSLRARRLFFEHLKDRRKRLRNIALDVLPGELLNQYGITAKSLPDKTAMMLWDELQERKDQLDQVAVGLSDSLKPYSDVFMWEPKSFFDFPHRLEVAVLALDYGLRPTDESGVPTLLSRNFIPVNGSHSADEVSIAYVDWLLRRDLELEFSLGPFRLSALHRFAIFIGNQMCCFDFPGRNFPTSELQRSQSLLTAICRSKAQCNIPCPCLSGIFNRPLTYLFSGLLWNRDYEDREGFFWEIREIIDHMVRCLDLIEHTKCDPEQVYVAKCAIHILTMMSLGVRHLPICYTRDPGLNLDTLEDPECEEEWSEILDEDQGLIEQLCVLDEEFGEVFDQQNVSIADFLQGYWMRRMEEVTKDLDKPLDDDDRCGLWEAGVVLDEDENDDIDLDIEMGDITID